MNLHVEHSPKEKLAFVPNLAWRRQGGCTKAEVGMGCHYVEERGRREGEQNKRGAAGKQRMEECAAALDRTRPLFETTFHECLLCAIMETQQAIIAIQCPVVLKPKVALFISFYFPFQFVFFFG